RPATGCPKGRSEIRIRKQRGDFRSDRIDAPGLNDVSNHTARLARYRRITERILEFGKVALLHQRSGHGALNACRAPRRESLHVEKEEGLILDDRATKSSSKLVLRKAALPFDLVRGCVFVYPGVGIEDAVAHVLKQIPVVTVRARFDCGVNYGTRGVSELRGVGTCLHAKFLHGVRRRLHDLHGKFLKILGPRIVVDSIETKIILKLEISVHAEAIRSWICGPIKLLYTRLEEREVCITASV